MIGILELRLPGHNLLNFHVLHPRQNSEGSAPLLPFLASADG